MPNVLSIHLAFSPSVFCLILGFKNRNLNNDEKRNSILNNDI